MPRARRTPRIVGIDVARGLAILGMFVAHTYPRVDETELLVDGRSSILFATLAGVSLGLLTGGDKPLSTGRLPAVRGVVIRALFLFLLGVALSVLPSHVAVILDYYGIMFLVLAPALFLPRAALAILAAVFTLFAPLLADAVRNATPPDAWSELAVDYLLIGDYPALVWLPFLLVGLFCVRSGITRAVTQRWMVAGGVVAMLIGYGSAATITPVSAEAHSGTMAEVVGSGGFAIAMIGILLWLGRLRAARIVLSPIAAAGAMPLTIYTLQVLVLAGCSAFAGASPWVPDYPGWPLLFGLIAGSLLFAVVWRHFVGAGPLEWLLRVIAGFDRLPTASRKGR